MLNKFASADILGDASLVHLNIDVDRVLALPTGGEAVLPDPLQIGGLHGSGLSLKQHQNATRKRMGHGKSHLARSNQKRPPQIDEQTDEPRIEGRHIPRDALVRRERRERRVVPQIDGEPVEQHRVGRYVTRTQGRPRGRRDLGEYSGVARRGALTGSIGVVLEGRGNGYQNRSTRSVRNGDPGGTGCSGASAAEDYLHAFLERDGGGKHAFGGVARCYDDRGSGCAG